MSQRTGRKAVVGADFGARGDDALVEGLRFLAVDPEHVLHALHVLDPDDVIDGVDKPALVTEEEVLERAPTLLRERIEQLAAMHRLKCPALRVFTHARIGKTVDILLQASVDYEAIQRASVSCDRRRRERSHGTVSNA